MTTGPCICDARVMLSLAIAAAPLKLAGADDAKIPEVVRRSVVRLEGKETCATGFLSSDNRIYTASHAVNDLCPKGICEGITLAQTFHMGDDPVKLIKIKPRVFLDVPSLDVGILDWPNRPLISVGIQALARDPLVSPHPKL